MKNTMLLFSLRENAFAVRKEEVAFVAQHGGQLHRLPLSPSCVAGMALIEDKGTTIIDLGVCIGERSPAPGTGGAYLIVGEGDRRMGFLVEGSVETFDCPDGTLLNLPGPVRSEIVEACVLRDSRIIPIINIRLLQDRINRGELSFPEPEGLCGAPVETLGEDAPVRAFVLGGDLYCVNAAGSSVLSACSLVQRIPCAGKQAAGVVYHDGEIIPLLPVAERLGLTALVPGSAVLAVSHGGSRYALLISEDRGVNEAADFVRLPLPPLVGNGMIREAAVRGNSILPILRISGLLGNEPDTAERTISAEQYAATSTFKASFLKAPIELSEFTLFGSRTAVPQEEVLEVLPMTTVRQVPRSPSLVLGIVERSGKLLPVLDLAAIFGKRSFMDDSWSLVRIKNGNFDALIAVEKVLGTRKIGTDIQRRVPIMLPYDVVYGCYLDVSGVCLILDVEALAVHFEKDAMLEFLTAVGPAVQASTVDPDAQQQGRTSLVKGVVEASPAAAAAGGEVPERDEESVMPEERAPAADKTRSIDEPGADPDPAAQLMQERIKTIFESRRSSQASTEEKAQETPIMPELGPAPGKTAPRKRSPWTEHAGKILIAAIAAVLVAYAFIRIPDEENVAVPTNQDESAVASGKSEKPVAKETVKPKEASLVLTVPKTMAVREGTVYVVVKGDTLWGISKRFTGDPFDFPRVARDNSIAKPDLIFPGQTIRLKNE